MCLKLNVKALKVVGVFNHKKVLIGAFSVIVKTDGSFATLVATVTLYTSVAALLHCNGKLATRRNKNFKHKE